MDKLYLIDTVLYPCNDTMRYSVYAYSILNLYDIDVSQGRDKRIIISCMLDNGLDSERMVIDNKIKVVKNIGLKVITTYHHFTRHPIDILLSACNIFREELMFKVLYG